MRRLPPLAAVRVFEATARHENFTRAASELGMTQAAVSYQIRLLEQRLGVPLFRRSKQRVLLTDAARKAAPLVSSAFDTLADAFGSMMAEDEAVLSITTTQTFASKWLAPRLGAFQLARPELAVRLNNDDRAVDFAQAPFDLAIRGGAGDWPGLCTHFLFRFHATPLCSPNFLRAHPLATPADLLSVPRISASDSWWTRWFSAAGVAEPELAPQSGIWLDGQTVEGTAAIAGHGVAILSPIFWQPEIAAGQLVQPFAIVSPEAPAYWLAYPEHKRNQAKVRAFRDWLLAEVATQAKQGPAEAFQERN